MIDNLNRLWRQFRPMYYGLLARLNGFKIYPVGGGEDDPPTDTPPTDTPPTDAPPTDAPPTDTPPTDAWYKTLPEDVQQASLNAEGKSTLEKFADPAGLAKSYVELEKKISAKGVIVPGPDATPEQKEQFLNALGRPEKPEGYQVETIENLHESIKVTDESKGMFQQAAHKIGLTNEQANELNKWYLGSVNQMIVNQEKSETEAMQKAETALRQEWGDKFDANKNAVANLIMKAGGQEAIDAMGGVDGIGNNVHVLKALGTVASLLSEDQINNLQGPANSPTGGETQEIAKNKITTEFNNTDGKWHKALMDETDPKHGEAVAERQRLYKIAYPGGV